jgi:hypothetical protein
VSGECRPVTLEVAQFTGAFKAFASIRAGAIFIGAAAGAPTQIFVDLGSATNSCQVENRMPNSPGHQPCTELETRAGTWLYDATKIGQHFSAAERYATGLRNGEGFAFDASGRLFVTQHGRDQLSQNWSKLYTSEQSARQPAEEIVLTEIAAPEGRVVVRKHVGLYSKALPANQRTIDGQAQR